MKKISCPDSFSSDFCVHSEIKQPYNFFKGLSKKKIFEKGLLKDVGIMKTIFFLIVVCSLTGFAQDSIPKQITNFDFDCRNPVFMQYHQNFSWEYRESELFFEAIHSDSSISICSLKYDEEADSFYQFTELTPIIDSNVINRNVVGEFIPGYNETLQELLLWETNGNGNWDIAFSIDSGNGWTPAGLFFSSDEDELGPSFILHPFYYDYQTQFLYSKGSSVFLCTITDSVKNELLFEGNDSLKYSDPAGAYSIYNNNLYAVAVEESNGKEPRLVYRKWNNVGSSWSEINGIFDRAPSVKPKFVGMEWDVFLSFEVLFGEQKKKVLLIHPDNFGVPGTTTALMDDPSLETSDFSSFFLDIITRGQALDFSTYFPFSFKFQRNDSTFIRTGILYYYLNPYIDFFTKVKDAKPALGLLSMAYEGAISYTVWEDSSGDKINLYGLKRVDPLGDVEDESGIKKDFSLFQNYPNPFNPRTNIGFRIANSGLVTLKIYDVLGKEVATLVNEEKPAGEYKVEFDGNNMSSGIYYYKLQTGTYSSVKKMILLK